MGTSIKTCCAKRDEKENAANPIENGLQTTVDIAKPIGQEGVEIGKDIGQATVEEFDNKQKVMNKLNTLKQGTISTFTTMKNHDYKQSLEDAKRYDYKQKIQDAAQYDYKGSAQ